jgi:hypothetical protein
VAPIALYPDGKDEVIASLLFAAERRRGRLTQRESFKERFNPPEAELAVPECCCSCVLFIRRNLAKVVLNAERWSIE